MLCIAGLCKEFNGCCVLKEVNIELSQGEFCMLIGNNGSGKSTLLRSISGEYQVDAGRIQIAGEDITKNPLHYRAKFISSVTQDIVCGTIPEMTLLENIVLSQLRIRKSRLRFFASHARDINDLIKDLGTGLESYLYSPLRELSGGQRQIIATLMALSSDPQLLLLDEHTSALDPKMQVSLMEYTASKISALGVTTLMITHNLEDAISYGDRLIMLHQGQIVLDVRGEDKSRLKAPGLLKLFHHYEDMTLTHTPRTFRASGGIQEMPERAK
jgi:putative ABC transport system ATP-binding protein